MSRRSGDPGGGGTADLSAGLASFAVRSVAFDEWVDIDTLVHRSSVTSGDFDYVLRPLCTDCGAEVEIEYETLELEADGGREVISALVCTACQVLWEPDQPED
ncbi:MAG: hypothetical protein OXH13_09005 [Chloroflexi bacterium]|nr:hypothetical protein [Chloroflexota bacterium]MCY3697609.1 hypothetical protein [Chloroflexota bacterium]MXX31500.1 hypothetical protein [Chloroflexota bacterium]MXX81342.1 hypothetical protein [Chloroflexota bacterium]MYB21800.1 hypothetical protein [Chloroflexota bacterium]